MDLKFLKTKGNRSWRVRGEQQKNGLYLQNKREKITKRKKKKGKSRFGNPNRVAEIRKLLRALIALAQ